jgi:sugar-specific transcriptional regulator TrmB
MDILNQSQQQPLSRKELINWQVDLVKSAKKKIVVIAGEFNTLESLELVDSLIEKLKQGVSEDIYIYDPKPQRKNLDKLLSHGATAHLYGDVLLRDENVTEEDLNNFNQALKDAEDNALKLSHSKLNLILAIVITITLFGTAIIVLPFPLNILVGIACLGPFLLEMATLKEVYHA